MEGAGSDGVVVRPSSLPRPQFEDGLGVFAAKPFKAGEVVIRWSLRELTREEYDALPEEERRQFTHARGGRLYLYPDPERHVNRSPDPNARPDFAARADVATRDIEAGDEVTIPESAVEDWGA